MPPNTGSGTILDQFECSYKKVANPYSETKHACFEECPGTSESGMTREHEAPEPSVEDTVRVTTRARLTYELYNYNKNAMLIVTSLNSFYDPSAEVAELKTTFEKFRFEVDVVYIGLNNVELYETCEQFFQRDFTDYGAVALVIMNHMRVDERHPGFESRFFEESVIMENFKVERNPTLADKPKIYITQIHRGISRPLFDHFNAVDHATHGDLIGIHSDIIDTNITRVLANQGPEDELDGPLKIFRKKLDAMGDNVALPEIIKQTMKDSDKNYWLVNPFFPDVSLSDSIGVVNTLKKELYLARVEENL